MNYFIRPFLIALQFLTRLPIPFRIAYNDQALSRSLLFYPVVGAIIGLLLSLVIWGLDYSNASSLVSAAIVLSVWVVLSSALHLDGLADSADAWLGGFGDREKTLAIMKDPASGPAAVVTLTLVLLLKCLAIEQILTQHASNLSLHFFLLISSIPLISRMLMVLLFVSTPYARESGLGSAFQHTSRAAAYIVILLSITAVILCLGMQSCAILVGAALLFIFCRATMMHRLQGCTGDTAGALLELSEVAILLAVVFTHNQ